MMRERPAPVQHVVVARARAVVAACALALRARAARARAVAAALLFALPALLAARAAIAAPELRARASHVEVEVGETFLLELKALVEQGASMPGDPELRAPRGITVVSGPSISTQMQTQIMGGVASVQVGLGATWQLVANKPGRYVIPAPTIAWEGKRLRANPVDIRVVAQTGRPRRPRGSFLLPGGPMQGFPWPLGGSRSPFDDEVDDALSTDASELALSAEPDPVIFLRAIPDKTEAVVGEQVMVSFYLYFRDFAEMSELHEAPVSDFLRFPLLKNPGSDPAMRTRVGGRRYNVRLLDRMAIFPLKAGDLHTGQMSARMTGRRIGSRVLRRSNDLVIRVTEPPRAGRPPGYTLGDVGQFSLSAAVQPRGIDQGGSVAVTIRVTGTGNFPQSLRLPERKGLEWLEPEKREAIEPRAGVVGGFRSFGYVVRVQESGVVDLGAIELPYWDPEAKRYAVERAPLGTIQSVPVTPSAAPAGAAPAPSGGAPRGDPFAAMPGLRPSLSAYAPPSALPIQGAPFWALLAAPPLLVALFGVGDRLLRRARARRAARVVSPARLSAAAHREAEEAAARGDVKETAAAVERAVHRAIEAATSLRSRGVLLDELPGELTGRGVPAALAERVHAMLAACDAVRFEPTDGGGAEEATDLAARGHDVMTDLSRWKPR